MSNEQEKVLNQWCDRHDMTYFVDSDNKHCLCDVDLILRFESENELFDYIDRH